MTVSDLVSKRASLHRADRFLDRLEQGHLQVLHLKAIYGRELERAALERDSRARHLRQSARAGVDFPRATMTLLYIRALEFRTRLPSAAPPALTGGWSC
jgi:hypothetical protein